VTELELPTTILLDDYGVAAFEEAINSVDEKGDYEGMRYMVALLQEFGLYPVEGARLRIELVKGSRVLKLQKTFGHGPGINRT